LANFLAAFLDRGCVADDMRETGRAG
jgi:hypothetical protein